MSRVKNGNEEENIAQPQIKYKYNVGADFVSTQDVEIVSQILKLK